MTIKSKPKIPESELVIEFSRSGGPGGQNVNKVNSKARVRFNVGMSQTLSDEQKLRLRQKLGGRITSDDELVITSESERSQLQNRAKAEELMRALIEQALIVPKKRYPTKPTRSSKEKRLVSKKTRSKIKTLRGKDFEW